MAASTRIATIEFSKDSKHPPYDRLICIAYTLRKGKRYGTTLQEMRLLGPSDKATPGKH
jgi:hypothetical protein